MATIEIEVPVEFADEVDELRGAIVELLATAAHEADVSMSLPDGRVLLVEVKDGGRSAVLRQLLEQVARNPGGLLAVSGLLETLTLREGVLRHVTDTVANQPVSLGPATAGQIALVDQGWRGIESRYGALDAGGYAELVGSSPTSRSVATKAKAKGLVGYRRGRRILYPCFQFDDRGLRPGWSDVVAPLRDAGWDDEDIVLWLAAPHGSLGRRSPVEALDDGDDDLVLGIIRDETAGVW
ncbi:hypothetical protein [Nocardioides sp. URHA0032]|uniref:hypothetical protein n=1 Tax=Nocardioides sp. URHA0032 TaxID=1380388 RepID=UPI00048F460E|nr:hypothetical protein [Nocardioides sp. URHA0032]